MRDGIGYPSLHRHITPRPSSPPTSSISVEASGTAATGSPKRKSSITTRSSAPASLGPNAALPLVMRTQAELPLAAPKRRAASVEPEEATKVAIARRAKLGAPPGYVRLVLSLELRRALAEQLSARAIRAGKNLEGVVIDLLEARAKRGRSG